MDRADRLNCQEGPNIERSSTLLKREFGDHTAQKVPHYRKT